MANLFQWVSAGKPVI